MSETKKTKIVYFNTDENSISGDSLEDAWCDLVLDAVFDEDIDSMSVIVDYNFDVDADYGCFFYYKNVRAALDDIKPSVVSLIGEWDIDRSYQECVVDLAVEWCDEKYQDDEDKQAALPVPFDEFMDCYDWIERMDWYEENDAALWQFMSDIAWDNWFELDDATVDDAKKFFADWEEVSAPSEWWKLFGALNAYPTEFGGYSSRKVELGFWGNEDLQSSIKARFGIEQDTDIFDEVYLLVNNKSGKSYVFKDEGLFDEVPIDSEFGQLILGLVESDADLDDLYKFFEDDDLDIVLDRIETYRAGVPAADIIA